MQTAIEWLQEALSLHLTFDQKVQFEGLFQQAKEMEKDQILYAHEAAYINMNLSFRGYERSVKYYENTYSRNQEDDENTQTNGKSE